MPAANYANLQIGDKVIVHHNTFRKWFNVKGHLKDSSNFVKKDTFQATTDMIFAYDRGDGWKPVEDWIFVKPIPKSVEDIWNTGTHETQTGIIKIGDEHVGEKVMFEEWCEHKYIIDGELLYRMSKHNLLLLL